MELLLLLVPMALLAAMIGPATEEAEDDQPPADGADQRGSAASDRVDRSGDDTLWGTGGGNTIDAGAGNDTLHGLAGDDLLRGNIGDDQVSGGNGRDRVFGDAGDDSLTGGTGNDLLYGGTGSDVMAGGSGNDLLDSRDTDGAAGFDEVFGGTGDDRFLASAGDRLTGDTGADTYWRGLQYQGNPITITDFDPAEDILSLSHNQQIDPRLVVGRAGTFGLTVHAGSMFVALLEGLGEDDIPAVLQAISINGEPTDNPVGTAGNDSLTTTRSTAQVYGGDGDDTITQNLGRGVETYGGDGNDTLIDNNFSRAGNLAVMGDGDDRVTALRDRGFYVMGAGDDLFQSDNGGATVYGGEGDDIFSTERADGSRGSGDNLFRGGDGNDTYIVGANAVIWDDQGIDNVDIDTTDAQAGTTYIVNFDPATEVIVLRPPADAPFGLDDITYVRGVGGNLLVVADGQLVLELGRDLDPADLAGRIVIGAPVQAAA